MSIKRALALLLLLGIIASLSLEICDTSGLMQYAVKAPKTYTEDKKIETGEQKEEAETKQATELEVMLKSLDEHLADEKERIGPYAATLYADNVSFRADSGNEVKGGFKAVAGATYILKRDCLTAGRHLYDEEIKEGAPVVVVDEALAVALFRSGDPVDKTLYLAEKPFSVVGVVRHRRQAGDHSPYGLYLPLKALINSRVEGEMLTVSVLAPKGGGANSRLQSIMSQWQEDGTMHLLSKEKYRALLPLRLLLCALALLFLADANVLMRRLCKQSFLLEKQRLYSAYALRLLPRWLITSLGLLIIWAAWFAGLYMVANQLIQPVYVFPEWVPSVLVEWKEIYTTLWNNLSTTSGMIEMRTPELLTLRFLRSAMTAGCLGFGVLLIKPYGRFRRRYINKN